MLKKTTQYALWGLVYTQMQNFKGCKPGALEIAREIEAPRFSVAKTFQFLVRYGFILSAKGKKGGFYFDQSQPDLTIKEIIIATGENKILTECILGKKVCNSDNPCPVHDQWATIRESLDKMYSTITIQYLAKSFLAYKCQEQNNPDQS